MITILVTWMDGEQEEYTCSGYSVSDRNNLTLHPRGNDVSRVIPLCNVRTWTVDRQ